MTHIRIAPALQCYINPLDALDIFPDSKIPAGLGVWSNANGDAVIRFPEAHQNHIAPEGGRVAHNLRYFVRAENGLFYQGFVKYRSGLDIVILSFSPDFVNSRDPLIHFNDGESLVEVKTDESRVGEQLQVLASDARDALLLGANYCLLMTQVYALAVDAERRKVYPWLNEQ